MKLSMIFAVVLAASLAPALVSKASAQNTPIRPGYCFNRNGCYGRVIGFLYYNDCVREGGVSWKNWDTRECLNLGTGPNATAVKSPLETHQVLFRK